MNVSSLLSDQFAQTPVASYPALLWDCYIHYLWNYQPNSLVARIASTCRVLAILISLPIIVLALLDISSYGIARTLGVIDDVKASTSDTATVHQNVTAPSIRVTESQSSSPYTDSEHETVSSSLDLEPPRDDALKYIGASQPKAFYASEADNLRLSGVGVFSPATSRPPSPVLTRKTIDEGKTSVQRQEKDSGNGIRQRGRQADDIAEE